MLTDRTDHVRPVLDCEVTVAPDGSDIQSIRCHTCERITLEPLYRLSIGREPGWSMHPVLCLECVSRLTLAISTSVRDQTFDGEATTQGATTTSRT